MPQPLARTLHPRTLRRALAVAGLALAAVCPLAQSESVAQAPGFRRTATLSGSRNFGSAGLCLAAAEDTLVVGGAEQVDVYERGAAGAWSLSASLTPASADPFTAFGAAVAIDGDTIAVGAPLEDGLLVEGGAVYVFERDSGGAGSWGQVARLELPLPAEGDRFGASLALVGDTLFAGAPGEDTGASDAGALHVFARDLGGPDAWGEAQTILSPDGSAARDFGRKLVAEIGRLVVAGLRSSTVLQARLHVYEPVGGSWVEAAVLDSPAGSPAFGIGLALEGERLLVGEPFDPFDAARPGLVRQLEYDAGTGTWSETEAFEAPDGTSGDGFGWSLALAGELLAVGAPQWTSDPAIESSRGAVHLFERRPAGWQRVRLVPGTLIGTETGGFGWSVRLKGPTLLVGAPNQRGQTSLEQSAGNVHAYTLGLVPRRRP